jgi:plasmid stability protein
MDRTRTSHLVPGGFAGDEADKLEDVSQRNHGSDCGKVNARHGWSLRTESRETIRAPATGSGRPGWEPKEEPVIGKVNARHGWSLRTESRETIRAGDRLGPAPMGTKRGTRNYSGVSSANPEDVMISRGLKSQIHKRMVLYRKDRKAISAISKCRTGSSQHGSPERLPAGNSDRSESDCREPG